MTTETLPAWGPAEARIVLALAILPALHFEHTLTCGVLGAIPSDRASYRPEIGARTAGELALHIVRAEIRFLDGVADGAFRAITDDSGAPAGGDELVAYYRARFAKAAQTINATSGEDLVRVLDYRGLIKMPAIGFAQFAMHHTIHHRGQLSVYLRQMGIGVPRIYG